MHDCDIIHILISHLRLFSYLAYMSYSASNPSTDSVHHLSHIDTQYSMCSESSRQHDGNLTGVVTLNILMHRRAKHAKLINKLLVL